MTYQIVEQALLFLKDDEKAQFAQRFFKTGKGEYGEGDLFLGIRVPEVRQIAKAHRHLPLPEVAKLLSSPWHECRLASLLILIHQMDLANRKTNDLEASTQKQAQIVAFYLQHLDYINNWDLVDISAPYIIGRHILNKSKDLLFTLNDSQEMWKQRIAIVSCLYLIRHDQFNEVLQLCELNITHPHDLIHKACGWVLREVGKRDMFRLKQFLDQHVTQLPRTMLRYAIERMDEIERKDYLTRR